MKDLKKLKEKYYFFQDRAKSAKTTEEQIQYKKASIQVLEKILKELEKRLDL